MGLHGQLLEPLLGLANTYFVSCLFMWWMGSAHGFLKGRTGLGKTEFLAFWAGDSVDEMNAQLIWTGQGVGGISIRVGASPSFGRLLWDHLKRRNGLF